MKIKITGKNIDRFLRRLINHKIDLLDIKYGKKNEVIVKIYAKDYETLEQLKTIYDITILNFYGWMRLKKQLRNYKMFLVAMTVGVILLFLLTNIITKVEVIHSDKKIRLLLLKEVETYGLQKYHFKKNDKEIEKMKREILEKNKDTLEWIEIINIGTTYQIKVEERKQNQKEKNREKQNVVAKKSAIIKRIEAKNGVIVKEIDSYVKKGDTIISGEVYLNEKLLNIVSAEGHVYGEVWYKSSVEFPYLYYEEIPTGKKKKVYSIHFLNWDFDLFNFHPFKQSKNKETTILKHPLLPFQLVKEEQIEVLKKDKIYTVEEAIVEARKLAKQKMNEKLKENEHIISTKDLKVSTKESKIRLDVFFTVYENITDYQKIDEIEVKKKLEEQEKKVE